MSERYIGIVGVEIGEHTVDLGDGLTLQHANIWIAFTPAFSATDPSESPVRELWHMRGPRSLRMACEARFADGSLHHANPDLTTKALAFTLRLLVNPQASLPVVSNRSIATLVATSFADASVVPLEVQTRYIHVGVQGAPSPTEAINRAKQNWQTIHALYTKSAEFRLAADALDSVHFVLSPALALVSIWGAIEAIFSPATSELKFRVSSLIAAYLFPDAKNANQKRIAKLYDKRSAAAHGRAKDSDTGLMESLNLLREILLKIIAERRVPTRSELDAALFGPE